MGCGMRERAILRVALTASRLCHRLLIGILAGLTTLGLICGAGRAEWRSSRRNQNAEFYYSPLYAKVQIYYLN
jgi:hypothetical protein